MVRAGVVNEYHRREERGRGGKRDRKKSIAA
jgi:hypothetical protein